MNLANALNGPLQTWGRPVAADQTVQSYSLMCTCTCTGICLNKPSHMYRLGSACKKCYKQLPPMRIRTLQCRLHLAAWRSIWVLMIATLQTSELTSTHKDHDPLILND